MAVDPNAKTHSLTHMGNMSFDETYQLNTVELVGVDSNGNPRRVPVDESGSIQFTSTDRFNTNHIDDYTTTSVVYIGMEDKDSIPMIKKIDSTGNFPVFTYASVSNNPTLTTYALMWAARTTATYGTYGGSF